MPSEDNPVQQYEMTESVDFLTALDAAGIEHLEVDDIQTVVLYQNAILILTVTAGQMTAAREGTVELWEPPLHDRTRDPDDLLAAFIDELLAAI